MLITGSGSKATASGYDFNVGLWGGTGTVSIENGGALETNSTDTNVGFDSGDTGSVLITGAGSTWFANAGAFVGYFGTGTLTIANSGAVVIGETHQIYLGDGAPGTLNIGAYDGTTTGGTVTGGITAYGNGVINFNQTDAFTLDGALTSYEPGTGSLVQRGSGTTTLTNAAGFSGTTTIESGRLVVNTSLASSTLTVGSEGTLAGTGTVGALSIADGATIAPGTSPGTLNAGSTTFGAGGNYEWEINAAEGSAGTNWDVLNITGTLTITATAMDPFVIELVSLLGDNSAGALANFDAAQDYSYTIATASGGITGFSADAFSVSTAGFVNNLLGGAWSLAQAGNSLNLNFTASAVPEPSTYAAFAGLLALGFAFWRKRQRVGGA
ncbi:MAG: PEP-CTERM sorting domain-containing protein [Opitutaceae bacterium]|nr:PEP-CTERM sorting domain-containing protein [Opitutaceae bacterium]